MPKIVVLGDSIAYGKWDEVGGWVQRLRNFIDKKYNITDNKNIQVYNLGIPGEISTRLLNRAQEELNNRIDLADTNKNNLVIIAIGINDTNPSNWLSGFQTPPEMFKENIRKLITIAQSDRVKAIMLGLTPISEKKYEERFKGRLFNSTIKEYDHYLKETAQEIDIPFIPVFEILNNEEYTNTLIDGLHPNSHGHEMLFQKVKEYFIIKGFFKFITS